MRSLKLLLGMILLAFTSPLFAGPVNINTADEAALAANIKGIGLKKAAAIVEYRKTNGPFKSVEELINVKGIGNKLVDKNRADLLIDDKQSSN